jgi:hypothetical protein
MVDSDAKLIFVKDRSVDWVHVCVKRSHNALTQIARLYPYANTWYLNITEQGTSMSMGELQQVMDYVKSL